MSAQYTSGRFKAWADNGDPLTTARLYTYSNGTTTQKNAFTSATLATPCTYTSDGGGGLYIAMNSRGEAQLWLGSGSYTMVMKTSAGATIWSADDQTAESPNLALSSGSSLVGFLQAGTGAVARTAQAKMRDFYSVTDFGAVGDGSTDDTTVIQQALTAAAANFLPLFFAGKTYIVNPLTIPSNSVIHFHPKTIIKAKSGYVDGQRMINITSVSNVTIYGNKATCQMIKADYVAGEQRHGVFITSSNDVAIYDLRSIDTGGDGFYIGTAGSNVPSERVMLKNCVADNNRRQGLSITCAKDVWIEGGVYKNTTGTAPQAGIDVEPDNNDVIWNVNIVNVKTSGNMGSGIIVVPKGSGASANSYFSVNIVGHESYDDAKAGGVVNDASLRFDNGAVPSNQINGLISVSNCRSYRSNCSGINIGANSWALSPALRIDGVTITDPGTTATASQFSACGVSIYPNGATTAANDIVLKNVYCEDRRGTAKMYCGFFLSSGVFTLTNSSLIDCDATGYLISDGPFVFVGTCTNVLVQQQRNQREVSFSTNQAIDRYSGLLITCSATAALTLPLAVGRVGCEYEIWNKDGTSVITIAPNAADLIVQSGLVLGEQIILRSKGSRIKLKSIAAATWAVVTQYGAVAPQGFLDPKRVVYSTAAPTTRTWVVGDRTINSVPTVGQPKAWVCTVAGTPGTWVSEGVL